MREKKPLGLLAALCLSFMVTNAQSSGDQSVGSDSVTDKIANFPSKLFGRIQRKTANLDQQLTRQTEKYLQKMARREQRLQDKLYKTDSAAAKKLFVNSPQQYAALAQHMKTDTGSKTNSVSGEYQPHTDTLQGSLAFLQQNPQLLGYSAAGPVTGQASNSVSALASGGSGTLSALNGKAVPPQLQASISQLQALQAKMNDADQIKVFVQQRKQQIGDYISQHTAMAGVLGKDYQAFGQSCYYYSQQVRQYKEMLNNPDKLEQQALSLLNHLPEFQNFMKNNSQLAGLFNLPGNYGTPAGLVGLQTRDQVSQLINGQTAAGGSGGAAALQSNLQSAESQLDGYKDKLSKLGGGSGDMDMPDFKPNDQKTKTFWKRLEYGTNFQTTRTNLYYPNTADLGLSVGYKINNTCTAGIGGSLKLGLGNGWNQIAITGNGASVRSYLDVKLRKSFSAIGGFEYNYTMPFVSFQQIRQLSAWTKSGLIGIAKTISLKSRVFKKTQLQLLWDFLSYEQRPRTSPILYRISYNF